MNEAVATTGLRRRSAFVAFIGAYFAPIAAFAYVQRLRWGIGFVLALFAYMALAGRLGLPFADHGYLWTLLGFVALYLAAMVVAARFARAVPEGAAPRWYNRWYHYLWIALLTFVVFAALIPLRGQLFGYEPYRVPSMSMQPTLVPGDFIVADFRASTMANIKRGDIVVYAPAHHPEQRWIKRVIGLPGERITEAHGEVAINGVQLARTWKTMPQTIDLPSTYDRITLGADEYYLMGDNLPYSEDSRYTGPVQRDAIVAKARAVWFHWMEPEGFDASRIGPLADAPAR